ncbi:MULTISPECIES: alpha/beta fold hydrolase [Streptomyces]|uniref:alpha/beta fold hydrolase n=1 Tax=Streptomyces TaxID=1883 RepID=UPI0033FD7953
MRSNSVAYLTVNDTPIFYTDEGEGPQTVLFIHGGTCDSHDWAAQIGPFTDRYRVIAPDLRGHGRSGVASDSYRPADYVRDLAALIEALGVGPVIAVGHSLGGLVASTLAVEHPAAVRAVIAVDPSYGFETAFAADVAMAFETADPVGVSAGLLSAMEGRGVEGPPWLRDWHRRRALSMPAVVTSDVFRGIFALETEKVCRPAAEDYLKRRQCPVLTVSAADSLMAKGIDVEWDKANSVHPYSRSVAWDGVGHWLFQERAEEFTGLAIKWIEDLPS